MSSEGWTDVSSSGETNIRVPRVFSGDKELENDSCDSGMFSDEEDWTYTEFEKSSRWSFSFTDLLGGIFKTDTKAPTQNPTLGFPSYYCTTSDCQTFGKAKRGLRCKGQRLLTHKSCQSSFEESDQKRPECYKHSHHSCVWLQLLPDILPLDSVILTPPIMQINHFCKEKAINYRGDLSSTFPSLDKHTQNSILWYRYLGRQVESDLVTSKSDRETNFLSVKLRRLSRRVCGRCGSGFSMLFNRRLQCYRCQLGVCKNCCKRLTPEGNWICDACTEQKELQRQSCEWFYDHLHKSFNDFGSAKVMKSISHNDHLNVLEEDSSQVREHIEKVVEALIGENIDQVNINRLVNDPQYDGLFKEYHEKLSDALAGLVLSIQMVMENRMEEDENTTPTTAHIKLKNLINQLIIDAGKFKKFTTVSAENFHHSYRPQEEENSYENLLATAIINKVVTSCRQRFRGQYSSYKNVRKREDNRTYSSEESGRGASSSPILSTDPPRSSSYSERTRSSYGEEDDSFSSESRRCDEVYEYEENVWGGNSNHRFTIEEEIEEITTTTYDDSVTERIIIRKNPTLRTSSCPSLSSVESILNENEILTTSKSSFVPFPELGLDLINVSKDFSSVHSRSMNSWEENWFFKKQASPFSNLVKFSTMLRLITDDPVSMFVPNPIIVIRPQVGNRDVDEVSELSESNSVGSIELSPSSESEEEVVEEVVCKQTSSTYTHKIDGECLENHERDLEHTEYSVFPVTKSSTEVELLVAPDKMTQAVSGKIIELRCVTRNNFSADVAWFQNARLIEDDGNRREIRRYKKDQSLVHSLTIYDARPEDQGEYKVVAYNNDSENWHDFSLQVKAAEGSNSVPEIISFPDTTHSVEEGLSKKFLFHVRGYPEPRLFFFKDGRRLNRNENISIEYINRLGEWFLEIKRVTARDVGSYEAVAENRIGKCKRAWALSLLPVRPPSSQPESKLPASKPRQDRKEEQPQRTPVLDNSNFETVIVEEVIEEREMKKEVIIESGKPSETTPPGSIADREHRKWVELAVTMRNNPYSRESIEKRRQSKDSLTEGNFYSSNLSFESIQEVRNEDNVPNRIYCGLKSVDDTLYRRDYYINKNDDGLEESDPVQSTNGEKDSGFEPIEKLNVYTTEDSSSSASSTIERKAAENIEASDAKMSMSELSNEFSSVCSLNDLQDSGVGSSCEKSSILSGKVEAEVIKFQKDIEKVNKEKSQMLDWQMQKEEKRKRYPHPAAKKYYSSMDSLLSITEDSSMSSPDPAKTSPEPIISDRSIKNLNKKRVSISENSTVIISCYEDDEDRYDEPTTLLPSVKELVHKFMPLETEVEVKPKKEPRKGKYRFNGNNEIRSSKEIHSLTARSVPRQFREGLKRGLPYLPDKNIKIPVSDKPGDRVIVSEADDDIDFEEDEEAHVIYDSEKKDKQHPYPDGEYIRTPSPEHVGIPASKARLQPKTKTDQAYICYTSDDSCNNEFNSIRRHHPPSSTRRKQFQRSQNNPKF